MKRDYFSASSGQRFADCIANWATNYDDERKVNTRNVYSDIGNLVHGALEEFNDPNGTHERTFEELVKCAERAAEKYVFAEPLASFKRVRELLAAAYKMGQVHPTIPIHLMETVAVEQHLVGMDGEDWQMDSWVQPARGMLDRVGVIPLPQGKPNQIVLFIEDYKTGRPKSHDVLVNDDIQPPLYFLWTRNVLVPFLEAQGYEVVRIIGSWTYVAEGTAVPLYETDFDHKITEEYVANIQRQMAEFVTKYNEFMQDDIDAKFGPPPTNAVEFEQWETEREGEINAWLAKYERPNAYCSYCPRKGVCQTFQRLLKYDGKVDIVGANMNWDDIAAELNAYQTIEKNAKARIGEIKEIIPVYLDQEGLESIQLSNGTEIVANPETRKRYNMPVVREIMGDDFIINNATVTDTAIKRELDLMAVTNPDRARALQAQLEGAYVNGIGPRPVRTRKIDGARKTRSKR